MSVEPSRFHQGSHNHLLARDASPEFEPAEVEAIIVPTARPVAYLRDAVTLAGELDCTLVVLCSKLSGASEVEELALGAGVRIVAVQTDEYLSGPLPPWKTTSILREGRPSFLRQADTSEKRNLGLAMATAVGWKRIVFLDDDIRVPVPGDLRDAAGLLTRFATVGLANGGFPDNSVVCHAYREAGGAQEVFIGGGALAVGAPFDAFFPNIYNEDWFFLLDDDCLRPTAVTGLAIQAPYDPYSDDRRARGEELGDCLAEGIFGLLDVGGGVQGATVSYWRDFLARRRRFIEEVISRVAAMDTDPAHRGRMITALKAARGRNMLIEPELCAAYLRAWRADREEWRCFVGGSGPEKTLAALGVLHKLDRCGR